MRNPLLIALATALVPAAASAQVLITEVQPDPAGVDDAEFVEIHNIGTSSVSLAGWTLNDYSGTMPNGESMTRWAFPMTASIAPGQVIVVARSVPLFIQSFMRRPTYEMAIGSDDPMTPNVLPSSGTTFQLTNGATGDAVILRDGMNIADAVEWGSVDRTVAGTPLSQVPGSGQSVARIARTGDSRTSFIIATTPTPFSGFGGPMPPMINGTTHSPRHVAFGDTLIVTSTISDADGVSLAEVYFATATSSRGTAATDYASQALTVQMGSRVYNFSAPVENLAAGLGFNEPATFHDRYVRYFISAQDTQTSTATDPTGADDTAANMRYRSINVMPRTPSPIQDVRAQGMSGVPTWTGHSVRVRGTAVIGRNVIDPMRTNFMIEDNGYGIAIFSQDPGMDIQAGQRIEVTGRLDQFNGLTQITTPNLVITPLGMTASVAATQLTIAQLLQDAERHESRLIEIRDVDFENAMTSWPNPMGSGANITISDGTGTVTLRLVRGTGLFGMPAPQYGFHVKGVFIQFAAQGTTGGYQILPRGPADITAKPMPPQPDAGPVTNPDAAASRPDATTSRADAGTGDKIPEDPVDDGGCSCKTSRSTTGSAAWILVLAGALVALRRRRRG